MKNKMLNKFYNMKLQKKLNFVFGALIFTFWIIEIVALSLNFETYDEKIYLNTVQKLVFYSEKIDESIKEADQILLELSLDSNIQQTLVKLQQLDYTSTEYKYNKYLLKQLLYEVKQKDSNIENIIYTNFYNEIFQIGSYEKDFNYLSYLDFAKKVHNYNGTNNLKTTGDDFSQLIIGRDILSTYNITLDYLGTIMMTYNIKDVIESKYNSFVNDNSMFFIYSNNKILFQNTDESPTLPEFNNRQGYEVIKYKNEKYLLCFHKSYNYNVMYVNMIPYSDIYGQTSLIKKCTTLFFTLLFVIMIFVSKKIASNITRPLDNLYDTMKIVQDGDFSEVKKILLPKEYDDEIGTLVENFEIMLGEIDYLINENYKKQLLLKDAQFKMLQAQINPHFLYNTLNTINIMVKIGDKSDTSKMIVNLGSLLRYTLAENESVKIKDELSALKSYIEIQMFRYKSRVTFTINSDKKLEEFIIPKMILQPLVENAISYGVENSLNVCNISINIIDNNDFIIIEVIDDGIGMDKDRLEKVKSFNFEPKGHGIGLKNIYERLDVKYNEHFKMNIYSEINVGTKIKIKVSKNYV